jgi:hypothetical protein
METLHGARGHFGQNVVAITKFCPNPGALRIKRGRISEILSEPGVTSDKMNTHQRNFVRTRGHFGLNGVASASFCPNLGALQTKGRRIIDFLSEPGGTSDKRKTHHRFFVRTRGYFRQKEDAQAVFCPNLGTLQTK